MLLMLDGEDGAIYDCVELHEHEVDRYTEKDWVQRYDEVHGFDTPKLRRSMIAENSDENTFQFNIKKDDPFVRRNADKSALSNHKIQKFNHIAWKHATRELELQFVEKIAPDYRTIGARRYTNVLLRFEQVC
jgi:hypothetical protein